MNFVRTISIFSAVAAITMTAPAWAANDEQHDSHHPASAASEQITQASPSTPGIGKGMGGMAPMQGGADQMKAMQQMHEQMVAAKTPDERNALMDRTHEAHAERHEHDGRHGRHGCRCHSRQPCRHGRRARACLSIAWT